MAENNKPERRRGPGRPFPKGVSGNPGGRPKVVAEVMAELEKGSPEAAARLVELIGNENGKVAIMAATAVLDRVIGKPKESMHVEGDLSPAVMALVELAQRKKKGESE